MTYHSDAQVFHRMNEQGCQLTTCHETGPHSCHEDRGHTSAIEQQETIHKLVANIKLIVMWTR
jgi:hypothetical protein